MLSQVVSLWWITLMHFDVDLFLTTRSKDAQKVIDAGGCATAILKELPEAQAEIPAGQVRIAFDEASELVYKTAGLKAFEEHKDRKKHEPMTDIYLTCTLKYKTLNVVFPMNIAVIGLFRV